MDTIMELDDLKTAWTALDRRLERESAIHIALLRDRKLSRTRSSLRPLYVGQLLQMLFGVAFIVLAARLWSGRPDWPSVIAAGVVVQAYGVVCIALAGATLGRIARIDYAAP